MDNFNKHLDTMNFDEELRNFSKCKDGVIVLDDNYQFWKQSKMEYQDELLPRDLRPNAPNKKMLKAGYIPSKRYFDWNNSTKHQKKKDSPYLTFKGKIPRKYNKELFLTEKGDQLLSLYDFLEKVGRRWIQLKNTNKVLAKDYPITTIMEDEMQKMFPKLRYYLRILRADLIESVTDIIVNMGRATVVDIVNDADVVIIDTHETEIMKEVGEIVNVKICVNLSFVYDYFFHCKPVRLEEYQLTPKRLDLFIGVPADEI